MDKWQRRTIYYSFLVIGTMLGYAVLYQNGMRIYEGEPKTSCALYSSSSRRSRRRGSGRTRRGPVRR